MSTWYIDPILILYNGATISYLEGGGLEVLPGHFYLPGISQGR